jgi:hypothetical protein
MARLKYTTLSGKETSIQLPAEAGCTAEILWCSPRPGASEQDLESGLKKLGIPELARDGDHFVYGMASQQVAVIVQPQEAAQPAGAEKNAGVAEAAMLIHRSRREWIVVAQGVTRLSIDEQPVPLIKIVKDGMRIRLGELDLTFQEVDVETVDRKMQKALQDKRCPFCGDPFLSGEDIIRCPSCGTLHHAECWSDFGERCSGPPGCRYGMKSERTPSAEGQSE